MKILLDMNLTPEWVEFFRANSVDAEHWSHVGDVTAPDEVIMDFARRGGYVVFTHDLDFGNILAATNARGPSVIQVRTQDPTPRGRCNDPERTRGLTDPAGTRSAGDSRPDEEQVAHPAALPADAVGREP